MNESNYSTASDPEIALGVECALPCATAPSLARVSPKLLRTITGRGNLGAPPKPPHSESNIESQRSI